MRALVFLAVLAIVYTWPLFGGGPGEWSALFQGVMIGAIVSTAVTPAGWKAIRRIRSRLDGSYSPPRSSRR
jgi:hypothetical protein